MSNVGTDAGERLYAVPDELAAEVARAYNRTVGGANKKCRECGESFAQSRYVAVRCSKCRCFSHQECVRNLKVEASLLFGDQAYDYVCAACATDLSTAFKRSPQKRTLLAVVILALWNLSQRGRRFGQRFFSCAQVQEFVSCHRNELNFSCKDGSDGVLGALEVLRTTGDVVVTHSNGAGSTEFALAKTVAMTTANADVTAASVLKKQLGKQEGKARRESNGLQVACVEAQKERDVDDVVEPPSKRMRGPTDIGLGRDVTCVAVVEPEPTSTAVVEPEPTSTAVVEPGPASTAVVEPEPTLTAVVEPEPTSTTVVEPTLTAAVEAAGSAGDSTTIEAAIVPEVPPLRIDAKEPGGPLRRNGTRIGNDGIHVEGPLLPLRGPNGQDYEPDVATATELSRAFNVSDLYGHDQEVVVIDCVPFFSHSKEAAQRRSKERSAVGNGSSETLDIAFPLPPVGDANTLLSARMDRLEAHVETRLAGIESTLRKKLDDILAAIRAASR